MGVMKRLYERQESRAEKRRFKKALKGPYLGLSKRMPFGRYKGDLIIEVAEKHPDYIHWMLENTELRLKNEVLDYMDRIEADDG